MLRKFVKKVSAASKRTLVDQVDSYDRLEKLVHTNGVCVTGEWEITEKSKYSGLFSEGSKSLLIGRISTALGETKSGQRRSFGFAGKLFGTQDVNQVAETANFFTVDVLSGSYAEKFLDVSLTNHPNLIPNKEVARSLLIIAPAFKLADSGATFRPVTALAQMQASGEVKSPIFMRLSPSASTVKNAKSDFREEVIEAVRQNNNKLVFNIEISDDYTKEEDGNVKAWTRLGQITIDKAIVSYGCDRQLHFAHPKDDKSNLEPKPDSAVKKVTKKVTNLFKKD